MKAELGVREEGKEQVMNLGSSCYKRKWIAGEAEAPLLVFSTAGTHDSPVIPATNPVFHLATASLT